MVAAAPAPPLPSPIEPLSMTPSVCRRFRRLVLLAWLFFLAGLATSVGSEKSTSLAAAMNSIVAGQLQAHVDLLADDAMAGREAGTPGGRAAAEYLAERLQRLGLKGAGSDGSYYQHFGLAYRNVLGKIDGRDPALAGETVVICAHYDHIGRGGAKSSLGKIGEIHNGADDNASGTSAVLELAEAFLFLAEPPRRTVLFAFWDAEEKGLLGSKHWLANPTVRRDKIVAAVNIDMIGRLRNDQLTLFGTRTAQGYRRLVSTNNAQSDLRIDFSWSLEANADHYPFVEHGIPVLFPHTGIHQQYHRDTDDARLVNSEGMTRVVRLLFGSAYDLAEAVECPKFRPACRAESSSNREQDSQGVGAVPQRFGVAWDPGETDDKGIELTSVSPGSVAETAGIRPGDRVVELAGHMIRSGDDLAGAVLSAVNPVRVRVRPREGEESREVVVQLEGQPLRLGVTWEQDAAEPGTVTLKQVYPGTAAAKAGLRPGDRIYQVGGRSFANDEEFAGWVTTLPGPLELQVERQGRVTTVVVHFGDETTQRAA